MCRQCMVDFFRLHTVSSFFDTFPVVTGQQFGQAIQLEEHTHAPLLQELSE